MAGVIDQSRQFRTLDGLRGMAALWIAVLHTPHFFNQWHLQGSFLAVDLFFALSGFVLANAYERRFATGLTPLAFLRLRVIRLYPLYLLSSLLGLVVALSALHHSGLTVDWNYKLLFATIPLSAVMLPTPQLGKTNVLFPLNPVLWSIFFELLINLAYVMAYPLLRRTRTLVCVVAVSGLALITLGLGYGSIEGGFSWANLPVGLARVSYSFFLGVLMFRLFDGRRRRASNLSIVLVLLLPLVFWLAVNVWLELLAAMVVLPAIVWCGLRFEPRHGAALFNAGGVASYALYALHKPIYQLVLGALIIIMPFPPEQLAPWIGLFYLVAILLLSIAIDVVYDAPARRWLSRRTRPAGRKAPVVGTEGIVES